jgi:hypothetical protein
MIPPLYARVARRANLGGLPIGEEAVRTGEGVSNDGLKTRGTHIHTLRSHSERPNH